MSFVPDLVNVLNCILISELTPDNAGPTPARVTWDWPWKPGVLWPVTSSCSQCLPCLSPVQWQVKVPSCSSQLPPPWHGSVAQGPWSPLESSWSVSRRRTSLSLHPPDDLSTWPPEQRSHLWPDLPATHSHWPLMRSQLWTRDPETEHRHVLLHVSSAPAPQRPGGQDWVVLTMILRSVSHLPPSHSLSSASKHWGQQSEPDEKYLRVLVEKYLIATHKHGVEACRNFVVSYFSLKHVTHHYSPGRVRVLTTRRLVKIIELSKNRNKTRYSPVLLQQEHVLWPLFFLCVYRYRLDWKFSTGTFLGSTNSLFLMLISDHLHSARVRTRLRDTGWDWWDSPIILWDWVTGGGTHIHINYQH